jgi:heme oxygenase
VAVVRSPLAAVPPPPPEASQSWLQCVGVHTLPLHAPADSARLAVLEARSLADYRSFLARIYGFEAAVECQVSAVKGLEVALYGARARLARLHQDLAALGLDATAIAGLPRASVTVRDASEGLGWLYVIERHVLLAGLIRRAVTAESPALARATAYFATHSDGGVRVREFGEIVRSSITHRHARPDHVIASARRAFDGQHHWYTRATQRERRLTYARGRVAVCS